MNSHTGAVDNCTTPLAGKSLALIAALESGNAETVKLLIDAGANVNTKDSDGKTALVYASKSGNAELVKLLLDAGANVNETETDARR